MAAYTIDPDPAVRRLFPPEVVIQIKALACELPSKYELPLSRFSCHEIASLAIQQGIVAQISGTTVWRWLTEDAIRPWQYRSGLFPRDPEFESEASVVLDFYHRIWQGKALETNEFVICSDEKTRIQARKRQHPSQPPEPGQAKKVEHEYKRIGYLNYLAAWDVQRARLFGRCESKTGIVAFDRLVDDVMGQEPYRSAKHVFWIVDNGSSHRGERSIQRIQSQWPNAVLVHLPVHASWLNQIEIYFSILQRNVLTPNDFESLKQLETSIMAFQYRYEQNAKPFEWRFTKQDLKKIDAKAEKVRK